MTVRSDGFFSGCGHDDRRVRRYELSLKHRPGVDSSGVPLRTVRVSPEGKFVTTLRVPRGTDPGRYYITYTRAPGDDYHFECPDLCAVPLPNLVVIGPPDGTVHSP